MGWAAVDNKHQVYENKPKKAFQKAKKIYGKRMEDAPTNPPIKSTITTNFDELLELRKHNASKNYAKLKIVSICTAFGLSFFLIMFLLNTLGRLT